MRGPIDPEQLLSPGMLKSANTLLTVCLAALSAMGMLHAIGHLFKWRPFTALLVAAAALAIPLAIWMIVRLLSEGLAAQHSLNERITLLNESLWGPEDEEWEEVNSADETDEVDGEVEPISPEAEIVEVTETAEAEAEAEDTSASQTDEDKK